MRIEIREIQRLADKGWWKATWKKEKEFRDIFETIRFYLIAIQEKDKKEVRKDG